MGFFMSVSRESIFFKHQVDQKYLLYIHEVTDTYIRDALDILGMQMFQDCAC